MLACIFTFRGLPTGRSTLELKDTVLERFESKKLCLTFERLGIQTTFSRATVCLISTTSKLCDTKYVALNHVQNRANRAAHVKVGTPCDQDKLDKSSCARH